MIREPYGVFPYNSAIDISEPNVFSLIFNGDELESYDYEIIRNNSSGSPIFESQRMYNADIYNDSTLTINVDNKTLFEKFLGDNLLWRIRLYENTAFEKMASNKQITRSTSQLDKKTIYLQNEDNLLKDVDLVDPKIIANITIRGERRKILSYNSSNHSIVVGDDAFSFLPSGAVNPDTYSIYTNYRINGSNIDSIVTATIPTLEGEVRGTSTTTFIECGIIPALENFSTGLLNKGVVNLQINNETRRIIKYTKIEYQFTPEARKVNDQTLDYTITEVRFKWENGVQMPNTTITHPNVKYEDLVNYKDTIKGFVTLESPLSLAPILGAPLSVYRNYYESNYYYFKARSNAKLAIENWPAESNNFPSRYYTFIGSYAQVNNIPIKYHIWEIYDITKSKPIYTSNKIFNSKLQFTYDTFENNHTYKIKMIVVNQDDSKAELLSDQLIVQYQQIDQKTSGEAIYNANSYSVDILWPDNRLSVPTLMTGDDGEYNYFFDYAKQDKQSFSIPKGTVYRYDNLSGAELVFDSSNYMLSTFIGIDDEGPIPWNGEIIGLSENFKRNSVSLVKDGYQLKVVCSDGLSPDISYPFFKYRKNIGGTYSKILPEIPFQLLKMKSGQDLGIKNENNIYRPLTKEEKIGYAYYWLDEQENTTEKWADNYFWTETESNTNCLVYKVLFYPNRVELYPSLRWIGKVSASNGINISVGYNQLLENRGCDCSIEIGDESRNIVSYDIATGTVVVDTPFSSDIEDKEFYCHYSILTNAQEDNYYVAEFTQKNKSPFNEIRLNGSVSYHYLTLYTEESQLPSKILDIMDYYFIEEWTELNNRDILINVTMDGSITSKFYEGVEDRITGFRIYRETFLQDSTSAIENVLIAEVSYNELSLINNNTTLKVSDFSIRNRGIFKYSVLPVTGRTIGVRIETNKVKTDWYEWIFTSLGRVKNNIYRPIEQWVFKLNLEAGLVNHNVQKVFNLGLGKYPKVSAGTSDYITTSLKCMVGDFNYHSLIKDNFLIRAADGSIQMNTNDLNNKKVYIEGTTIFEEVQLKNEEAYLFINKQQRRILYYGTEGVGANKKYFILIDSPFKYFMPNTQDPDTNHYEIYTSYLPKDSDNYEIEYDRRIIFEDSIERINAWNKFIALDEPVLIRDMKGNVFIGVIHDSSESTDIRVDDFLTTISFNMTQIDSVDNYLIFDV